MSQEEKNQPGQITDKGAVEVNEQELDSVQGGASDFLLELDTIKGESSDKRKVQLPGGNKITPGSIRTQKV